MGTAILLLKMSVSQCQQSPKSFGGAGRTQRQSTYNSEITFDLTALSTDRSSNKHIDIQKSALKKPCSLHKHSVDFHISPCQEDNKMYQPLFFKRICF